MRGRERSRDPKDVIEEAKRLAEAGFKEIVLTGIHLSAYGTEKPANPGQDTLPGTAAAPTSSAFSRAESAAAPASLASMCTEPAVEQTSSAAPFPTAAPLTDLIESLATIPGIERIRLGSLEPGIITEENIRRLAKVGKLCPHFHLSLQSACAATLKRMNRHYTPAEYEKALQLIRNAFECPAITTDVIAGFPGETEEEFEETLANLAEWKLFQTHIFKYSAREGTAAARMKDQVPEEVKTERSKRLAGLDEQNRKAFLADYAGRTVEVLLEEERDGRICGHTKEYVELKLDPAVGKPGDIVRLQVKPEYY